MEGSGGIPLTQAPPARDADEAALALSKRARKRSRYLSPPYTDVQQEVVAGGNGQQREEEPEQPPPDVSAAEALSALRAAAVQEEGHGADAAALRFLALYRNRNRRTADGGGGGSHEDGSKKPPSPAAADAGNTTVNLSAGPAMPRPHHGSPTLAKKKKTPQAPPAVKQQVGRPMPNAAALRQAGDGHIWASQSAGFAVHAAAAAYGAANPAIPEKRRKKYKKRVKVKGAGHEQQHFGNPVALILDFAAGPPLPSREELISTFRRFGSVIDSKTAIAQDRRSAQVAFATRAEAETAYRCAGALGAFGPPFVVARLQDLPPIVLGAPPPLPKIPLTDIRSNLEKMIASLNRRSSSVEAAADSPKEAMPAMDVYLVGEMQGLLAKVDKKLQGSSATTHRG